ncbi:hypothetical protein WJX81_003756 [Elliptochloris bilobata]|uniref:Rubredoxin-like domain-containing protein n=1 Tax=Elliptochloris bilobata TaxID=381761 RepID=A0AAW1SJ14_9CHLO
MRSIDTSLFCVLVFTKQTSVQRLGRRSSALVEAAFGSKATAKATFVCIDCGWIYDGRADFESLPGSFKCPVCNAPKRRFKREAPGGSKGGAKSSSRNGSVSAKSASAAADESGKPALLLAAVGGIVFLVAVYAGLNALY